MKIKLMYITGLMCGWHLTVDFCTYHETSVTSWFCVKPTKKQIRKEKKLAKFLIG